MNFVLKSVGQFLYYIHSEIVEHAVVMMHRKRLNLMGQSKC